MDSIFRSFLMVSLALCIAEVCSEPHAFGQTPGDVLRMIERAQRGAIPGMPKDPRTISRGDPRVAEVQRLLNAAGFEAGPEDGLTGTATRRAIAAFQTSIGAAPTGRLSAEQMARLEEVARNATGVVSPQQASTGIPDAADVQTALADLGYDIGTIDGIWGPRSQRALDAFRETLADPTKGRPTGADMAALTAALTADSAVSEVRLVALPVVDQGAAFRALRLGAAGDGERIALVQDAAPAPAPDQARAMPADSPVRLTAPDQAGRYDLVLIDAAGAERARLAISVQ